MIANHPLLLTSPWKVLHGAKILRVASKQDLTRANQHGTKPVLKLSTVKNGLLHPIEVLLSWKLHQTRHRCCLVKGFHSTYPYYSITSKLELNGEASGILLSLSISAAVTSRQQS